MPGLHRLRSTTIAGLSDIKCVFTYGTDYWKARQEVINRIALITNLPQGVTPTLSPWSPTGEIVRYVLEGPGYTLNELKAVQDWVLERQLKTVPGVIDVTGFGGTVKQYQVLVDPWKLGHYGITLQQLEDAISKSNANIGGDILSLGTQSHNVRGIGLLGKGEDPLDPANASRRAEIVDQKLEEISNVVITHYQGTPILVSHVAMVVEGHQPRLGIIGRDQDGKSENDVVQGIVLMRKYEKSLPVSEAVEKKIDEIQKRKLLPPGMKIKIFNQRTELVHVTTENVRAQLADGNGPGHRDPLHLLGRSRQRGDRGHHDSAGFAVLDHGAVRAGQIGQPAVDRRGRLRDHRRQLDDHRREHLPAHHGPQRRPVAAADRPDHRRVDRDRARALLLHDDHRLRVHPAVLDVRPRRRVVRSDGQHLCLCHLRRPPAWR